MDNLSPKNDKYYHGSTKRSNKNKNDYQKKAACMQLTGLKTGS